MATLSRVIGFFILVALLHAEHVRALAAFDCENTTIFSHVDARSVADCTPFSEDEIEILNYTAQVFQTKKTVTKSDKEQKGTRD